MSDELEREAIALWRSVPKWAVTGQMRRFFERLADRLGWEHFKGEMAK
jgi:hypothetical protein